MPMREQTPRAERLEWLLGYVSGAAVLTVIGYLLWQGLADQPPARVSVTAAAAQPNGQIRFTVRNDGGRTATDVAVALTLRNGDQLFAERRLVIDYVPGHSEAEGTFIVPSSDDPLSRDLAIEGYLDP